MAVYILHFEKKFKHASHYIGFAQTVARVYRRFEHHMNGSGARIMRAVAAAGIVVHISKIFPDGDRNFERKLKNMKRGSRACPWCSDLKKWRRYGKRKPVSGEAIDIDGAHAVRAEEHDGVGGVREAAL